MTTTFIVYWLLLLLVITVLGALLLLAIWAIAKTDTFFGFIKEGQGVAIMSGDSFDRMIISFKGHYVDWIKRTRIRKKLNEVTNKMEEQKENFLRLEILEGDDPNPTGGILGFLERNLGIYWFGIAPFKTLRNEPFNWNEWTRLDQKGNTIPPELRHREEPTKFFYAQSFNYAVLLKGAETGGGKKVDNKDGGGNLTVDVEMTLQLRIIYPQVALFENESWFEAGEAEVLTTARRYVSLHSYEELRGQENTEDADFSRFIMMLNETAQVGTVSENFKDVFGAEIVGVQVSSVSLAGDKDGKLAAATTNLYVRQQEKLGNMAITDGEVYDITQKGKAEADAIRNRTRAVLGLKEADEGTFSAQDGKFVFSQDSMRQAGEAGSSVIFTKNNGKDELDENKFAGQILITQSNRKEKSNGGSK